MHLSDRLLAIAGFVSEGNVLADIGTDHGYIPIYLTENDRIPRAIAMDVNKGPLEKARKHIAAHDLSDRIDTRLSDGLHELHAGEADTVLIAGMGGALMSRIIDEGSQVLESVSELIVQPQSEIREFRHFLHDHAYKIVKEHMLIDDGKFYVIMKVVHGQESYSNEVEYIYGHLLLNARDEVLYQLIQKELAANEKILAHLLTCDTDGIKQRIDEIKEKINYGKEALKYYEV